MDDCFGSYHLPVTVNVTFRRQSAIKDTESRWNFRRASVENWDNFKKLCNTEFQAGKDSHISDNNIENLYGNFYNKLKSILDRTMPKTKSSKCKKVHVPWWSDECTMAIKNKRAKMALKRSPE